MKYHILIIFILVTTGIYAQQFEWISSTENTYWYKDKVSLKKTNSDDVNLEVMNNKSIVTFKAWGTCFNELGWDAMNRLSKEKQEEILFNLFSPQGDLQFTMGRFSMNANDYARDWYSCDEVSGDFELKYFNIDRDRTTLIPYLKSALEYNPKLTFWISPWSPPSWMKINHYYSVVSNSDYNEQSPKQDYLLFQGSTKENSEVFPKKIAVTDYLIQDSRYLQTYADHFCKFIEAYKELGITIDKVMFQNESWSYTPYPGCAWTAEGIIKFNTDYLGPTLKQKYPEVALYLGTINTNRYDVIDKVLSDEHMKDYISGVGFQWEGGQILPEIRKKYPNYNYVQTESECGWGSFDWGAAEHTFQLINYYLGNGCEEYTFWNAILYDDGISGWGWKQNALIRVDSKSEKSVYTPEYYAVKHYTHFVAPGSEIVSFKNNKQDKLPLMVVKTPENKYMILAGNFNDLQRDITIKIDKKYLKVTLKPHSLNTFYQK